MTTSVAAPPSPGALTRGDGLADKAPILSLQDVTFRWPGKQQFGLNVPDFRVASGEHLLLLGPSGSGKSTLLSLIAGIAAPAKGSVTILDQDIAKLSSHQRDRFRAEHLGIVFQQFNLLPYGSARDNVLLALAFAPQRRVRAGRERSLEAEADRLLSRLGLDPSTIGPAPAATLSVGQQQRVASARALIGRPSLVIADEPTSALDRSNQDRFLELLLGETTASGATLIMVSHDETLANRFKRVARLDEVAQVTSNRTHPAPTQQGPASLSKTGATA